MERPPLPDHHETLLRGALKLEEGDNIPEDVINLYWDAERTARRIGTRVGLETLVTILLLAGRATTGSPVSFLDNKGVKHGTRVLAKFRNEWRWGEFKRFKGKAVIVTLDDETAEDREFAGNEVRFPTKEELKLIQV